jgi:tetratricopeptide (TPR) repeat protein
MNASAAARGRELAAGLTNAVRLLRSGQAGEAIAQCRALLERFADNLEVLRYLGLACIEARQFAEAEHHLTAALRLDPGSANLLNDLGVLRLRQRAPDEALDFFNRALDIDSRHGDALGHIGSLFTERGQPARARPYLQRLLAVQPFSALALARAARNSLLLDDAGEGLRLARKAVRLAPHLVEARLTLAEALETSGLFRQAKFQYLTLLRHSPQQVTALAKLLSMKETGVDDEHVKTALELLGGPGLSDAERAQLHLALARYRDRQGQYGEAFAQLVQGNSISWKREAFDSALFSRAVDRILAAFPEAHFCDIPAHASTSDRPVFIVGMPRSGTTLVEQILASHPAVAAGGELSTITNLAGEVKGAAGEAYPSGVSALGGDELGRLAAAYAERLDRVSRDAARVTDKMPFNFMHVGFIATLFPDATILHCRRDPLDTCLSCFFTSFGENLLFAGNLEALGRYYLDYSRLMAHWSRVLPRPPLDIAYERLVNDTEGTVRSLLAHCGLDWHPACLAFHRTGRGIRTPSRWQVRQPIYSRSIGRWRHYERELAPLCAVLAPLLEDATAGDERP